MDIEKYVSDTFPGLVKDPGFKQELLSKASLVRVNKGDQLIDYGSFIRFVPLVVDGLIKIMRQNDDDKEVLLYYLGPGNSCAASFSCCLVRKRSEIKAIAEVDSTILAIPLVDADHWMGRFPLWRNFVLEMYDQRLFDMIDTIDKLAFAHLDEKLMDYLEQRKKYAVDGIIYASHQEIANDLNASRETISRLLKKLENSKLIRTERQAIELIG